MTKTLIAEFDGEVLRFDTHVDLKPSTRYRITVEPENGAHIEPQSDIWEMLEELAGCMGDNGECLEKKERLLAAAGRN